MKKILALVLALAMLSPTVSAFEFPEPDWGAILAERQAMENETDFELYVEADPAVAPYYGAKHEPRSGAYIGTIPEHVDGLTSISNCLTTVLYEYGEYDLYHHTRVMLNEEPNLMTMVGINVSTMDVDYDSIRRILDNLSKYNRPMIIRFANEMNCSNLGDDPQKYVQVFRTVANMIHEYPQFAVVWSPIDLGALDRPYEYFYPGDEYVDWVGLSCYTTRYFTNDKNTSAIDSQYFMTEQYAWATNRVKPFMKYLKDNNIQKPVMICEGGVSRYNSHGDDYTGWHEPRLRNMLWYLIMKYPQIKMVNYFNNPFYNEGEHYYLSDYPVSVQIFNEASGSGAYIPPSGGDPEFVFAPANSAGTLYGENNVINVHTLAYVLGQPELSINYKIDGVWYHAANQIPYTCSLDLTGITDGKHTLTISASGMEKNYDFYKHGNAICFGYDFTPPAEPAPEQTPPPEPQQPQADYEYGTYGSTIDVSNVIANVENTDNAVSELQTLISSMSDSDISNAANIDLITKLKEEMISKAAAIEQSSDLVINSQITADSAATVNAAAYTLKDAGISDQRALSKTLLIYSDAEDNLKITKESFDRSIDAVKVHTSFASVTLGEDCSGELEISRLDEGKVKVEFSGDISSSLRLSFPMLRNDADYYAIVNENGEAIGGKYNPVTGEIEARIDKSGIYSVVYNEIDFDDIKDKPEEMQKAIKFLAAKGIINGTGYRTFSPDDSISRAGVAALVVRTLAKLDPNADGGFGDVTPDDWYFGAAGSSKKHGIINGFDDNTFRGNDVIAKDQIVAVAARVLKNEMGYFVPQNSWDYLNYTDADAIPDWAKEDVAVAAIADLVLKRNDGAFCGSENMTRGDAAIILYRLFMKIW